MAHLALTCNHLGDRIQVRQAYQRVTSIDSNNADAWTGLAVAWLDDGCVIEAVEACRQALALRPDNTDNLYILAYSLSQCGELDEAWYYYQELLKSSPGHPKAVAGQASILQWRGDYQQAWDMLQSVVQSGTDNVYLAISLSEMCHRFDACDLAMNYLASVMQMSDLKVGEQRLAHFALGRLHDANGDFGVAFEHYRQGNVLRQMQFDRDAHSKVVDTKIRIFDAQRMRKRTVRENEQQGQQLVFIVGMPRSGTSLVEQILSSHPEVYGAGELNHLQEISEALDGQNLQPEMLATLADDYMQRLPEREVGISRVTDKMPGNFMHLGLIQNLFPKARIIHCRRHPLDTCLSCYFQDFSGTHPYSFDLGDLGFYYREYSRLMVHWRKQLQIPMFEIDYEALVADQESWSRALIDFVGLDWNLDCLQFHKTKRAVLTASQHQVREPIYTTSTARYRHYQKFLAELESELVDLPDTDL